MFFLEQLQQQNQKNNQNQSGLLTWLNWLLPLQSTSGQGFGVWKSRLEVCVESNGPSQVTCLSQNTNQWSNSRYYIYVELQCPPEHSILIIGWRFYLALPPQKRFQTDVSQLYQKCSRLTHSVRYFISLSIEKYAAFNLNWSFISGDAKRSFQSLNC